MKYKFRAGCRINGIDAKAVGATLERIRKERGTITPQDVVKEARSRKSPLHRYIFGKSDSEAAEQYRLGLAAHLIRSIVIIREPESEPEPVFVCVSRDEDTVGQYTTTSIALNDEELRDVVLERAKGELLAFKRKYDHLTELVSVMVAITRVTTKIRQPRKLSRLRKSA